MTTEKLVLTVACAASAVALALPTQAQPRRMDAPCFHAGDMRNHAVADEHTLYIDVGGRSVYRAVMSNNCLAGATSSDPIMFRDQAGKGQVCHPIEFDISVKGNRCVVSSLNKLSASEIAALPPKAKP